jgi:hypothetical protein
MNAPQVPEPSPSQIRLTWVSKYVESKSFIFKLTLPYRSQVRAGCTYTNFNQGVIGEAHRRALAVLRKSLIVALSWLSWDAILYVPISETHHYMSDN